MTIDFLQLYHQFSKDHSGGGTVHIPADNKKWPEAWKTVYYKSYGVLPKLVLPHAKKEESNLFDCLISRKTGRSFQERALSLGTLSTLLYYSVGKKPDSPHGSSKGQRMQPSAGARFPIETYVLVLRDSDDVPAGIYHYNVRAHALDILYQHKFSKVDVQQMFTYDWVSDAAIVLLLTSVFDRTVMKYGSRGYRYALIEAGHIGQNIYLLAASLKLGCCGLGGTRDGALETLLRIDGVAESVVYACALGVEGGDK